MRKIFIIVFLFLYLNGFAQKDFKILSSNVNSITIEYTPIVSDPKVVQLSNQSYIDFELFNGVYASENNFGLPSIQSRIFNIGVPSEFGNSIKVLSTSFRTISGKIKPLPDIEKIKELPSYKYL
ncbi:MAG: hypothetical protein OQJ81_09865 [Melioribacteraceae bacterium]|nr:hypothetical protein [Melioribacteraceae bacterium]